MNDPITNQPVGEWITQDSLKPDLDVLRYRGKLSVVVDQTNTGRIGHPREEKIIKCIRCVSAFYRSHKEVVINRWMILPP